MTLRSRRSLAVLALVVALLAGFAVAALHRPGEPRLRPAGPPVAVQRSLSPRDPAFGDTVTATVAVVVDPRRVDVESVRVRSSVAPFRILSTRRTERRSGGTATIRVEQRLRCLDAGCVPPGATGTVRFGAVRVDYLAGRERRSARASWPVLRVHARVTPGDVQHPFLRVPPARPAAVDYRLPPRATGYTLLAVAGLLALGGAATLLRVGLAATGLPRRRRLSALDRILHELTAASANGDSGRRRRALEHLARELEPLDETLSAESRVLAWAPEDPRPEAIADLTGRVLGAVPR